MKRTAGAILLLAGLGGCTTADKHDPLGNSFGKASVKRTVPGTQGPDGNPVAAVGYTQDQAPLRASSRPAMRRPRPRPA